ncbi:SGNH/GDSL hydrolase family protein [Nocardioides mangrovicus]|uniref:SGNH/GDSL hydrolase family protein n=1 Tax=Nocardioides mangrovicus TaxID=2478913 RepID=A0A3L8P3J2_9ACTN|nr:SGNH/GDSL hydrolase family protein [Nocardioides mangrovicus]
MLTLVAVAGASGVVAGRELLRLQARQARRTIGKPLGEEALAADRTWKKKQGDRLELLMLGDSIAAGLGAERRKHTLGAQLARRTARRSGRAVRLHTGAVVGAESSALRAQLAGLPAGYRPDVAVVVVGGNDVTHRVRQADSVAHLVEAVTALRERGCEVVVGTCPDLGALTAVPQPLRALGGRASRSLAAAQRVAVLPLGAHVVALDAVGPFFLSEPDAMFAVDRFHPSGAGYKRIAKALLPAVLGAVGVPQPTFSTTTASA